MKTRKVLPRALSMLLSVTMVLNMGLSPVIAMDTLDQTQEEVCSCDPSKHANETGHSEDCPLYTAPELSDAVKSLKDTVDALPNVEDITEENRATTIQNYEVTVKAYEALSDEDKTVFDVTVQYTKLMALREVLYDIAIISTADVGDFVVDGGTLDTDYTYADNTLTFTKDGSYTVSMKTANTPTNTDKIAVESGITANITLNGVGIDVKTIKNACAFDIVDGASVNLTLMGENTLKSGSSKAGLQVPDGAAVTIKGTGSLTATGGLYGAGIGGGDEGAGGTITIEGGIVTATGGTNGAGIGGGARGAGDTITIEGGIVTATGGTSGAGIGGGYDGAGGTITIEGGIVTATGGTSGAGIGGGNRGAGGNITIEGGIVTATSSSGAGIGGGYQGAGGNITIEGGKVTATGGYDGAGIGGGYEGAGGTITIEGGIVTATGGDKGAGIGGGTYGAGGTITIEGGEVIATSGARGAGIGGGYDGAGGTITIEGGTVTATSSSNAGIGSVGGVATIKISGGTVTATSTSNVGIGSAGGVATIKISGGKVTATSEYSVGIGAPIKFVDTTIEISGGKVTATRGIFGNFATTDTGSAIIFTSSIGSQTGKNTWRGIIFENKSGAVYGNQTLQADLTVEEGNTLIVPDDVELTIPTGKTLTNNGTIGNNGSIENNGTFTNIGTLEGNGSYTGAGTISLTKSMVKLPIDLSYSGTAKKVTVELLNHTFEENTDYTVEYTPDNINVGEVTPTIIPTNDGKLIGPEVVGDPFTIIQSDIEFTGGVKTYKDAVEQESFIYGDIITIKVTPSATGSPKTRAFTEPTVNQMALYKDEVQLTDPQTVISGNELIFTIDTAGKQLDIGNNTITAKYVESTNMAGHEESVVVTLSKKQLTGGTITSGQSKTYDGNNRFSDIALSFSTENGKVGSDDVIATVSGTVENSDVENEKKFTVISIPVLSGDQKDFCSIDNCEISGTLAITEATPSVKVTVKKKEKSLLRSILGDHNDTIIMTATTEGVNGEKPEGSVVFKNGTTILATKDIVNGVVTYEWVNPSAGNYTISAEFTTSDSNYSNTPITDTAESFEVSKGEQKDFAINAVGNKTYGDAKFDLSTIGGSVEGAVSYASDNTSVLTISDNTVTIVGEGNVTITATKAGDSNFNKAIATYNITIDKATPTITWGSTVQTLTYTGSTASITSPTVALVNGETYAGAISYQYKSTATEFSNLFGLLEGYTEGLPTNAGEYSIIATVAEEPNGNYNEAQSDEMMLTIEKSIPTLTIDSMTGKIYDGTAISDPIVTTNVEEPKFEYTYYLEDGTKTNTTNSGSLDEGKAPVNVGNYYLTVSVAETANTEELTSSAKEFTITQAPLSITGGIVISKQWDGNISADVTQLSFEGLKNGETLEFNKDYEVGNPSFDTINVGVGKTVTGTAVLLQSGKAKNYSLTGDYNTTGNIILADGPEAPAPFTLSYEVLDKNKYTVIIPEVEGNEYSFDGITYSSTRTKTANVGDIITGYMRKVETATHHASSSTSTSIALPSFKLADYTKVDKLISSIPADLSIYTEVSVQALNKAIDAIERDKNIHEQDTVNKYATDLEQAIMNLERKASSEIEIITGGNQSIEQGKEAIFKSNADFAYFKMVLMDGIEVSPSNYTVSEGSTIVTLHAEYTKSLSIGKHTISIVSMNGVASTEFTMEKNSDTNTDPVTNTDNPLTGDDSNFIGWTLLFAFASGALTINTINKRKKKYS